MHVHYTCSFSSCGVVFCLYVYPFLLPFYCLFNLLFSSFFCDMGLLSPGLFSDSRAIGIPNHPCTVFGGFFLSIFWVGGLFLEFQNGFVCGVPSFLL
jgi:hypothetical protein